MNKLFSKYSIDEISKRTAISPLTLQRLKDEEFDKITKVKFKGFIRILKLEFPDIDFSDLEEKGELFYSNFKEEEKIIEPIEEKDYKKTILITGILLLLIILFLIFKSSIKEEVNNDLNYNFETNFVDENNSINLETANIEENKTKEDNITNSEINITNVTNNKENKILEVAKKENNISENNTSIISKTITIKPLKLIWFKVYYLDLNKSKEYLTSHNVTFKQEGRMFIRFGHGLFKLVDGNKTIFPNTKHIIKFYINKDEINITKKNLGDFR